MFENMVLHLNVSDCVTAFPSDRKHKVNVSILQFENICGDKVLMSSL